MNWAKYQMGKYPELRMLHHVPNGGYRNQIEARNLKLQGVKAGVPDLVLPVARGGYFGLYIELKADKNCKTSKNQELWIDDLRKEGKKEGKIDTGLVIQDASGNEYVWVVVPKSLYNNTDYNSNDAKKPSSSTDYANIEYCLHQYTATYRNGTDYSDTYAADTDNVGWFADATAYNNLKNSMLKSVYENGGFYVGRYEAGIVENRTGYGPTNSNGKFTIEGMPTPVTKADAYPYTHVTRTQAQNLASNANLGTKTSSLMFGVQWDLVLAFMSRDTAKINQNTLSELTSNSTTIGNYNNNLWEIKNVNAKYLSNGKFVQCSNPYKKESNSNILLTTGADDSFSVQNIYDIAGNVWEWTWEKTSDTSGYCARRGGSYNNIGSAVPATFRGRDNMTYAHYSIGFRVALW